MELKSVLADFLSGVLNVPRFKATLKSFQSTIWNVGLEEEEVHLFAQIYLECTQLDNEGRKLLLDCFIPRIKIPHPTIKALIAWFFTYRKDFPNSKALLSWMSVMLANKFVDSEPFVKVFNQFLLCFQDQELIPHIVNVLKFVVSHKTVSERSLSIINNFYERDYNYPEKKNLAILLNFFHACTPVLVPNPPKVSTGKKSTKKTPFMNAVSTLSCSLGFSDSFLEDNQIMKQFSDQSRSLKREVNGVGLDWNIPSDFWTAIKDIPISERMKYIARMCLRNKAPTLSSLVDAFGCREGQMLLCLLHMTGSPLPPDNGESLLLHLDKLLETCKMMDTGLPHLTPLLSKLLLSWDGDENADTIYGLITYVPCQTFEELYSKILVRLINYFITGTIQNKSIILDCMTDLLVNRIGKFQFGDIIKLNTLICQLIKMELAGDGLRSIILLMASLKYYRKISILEKRYAIGSWTVPPPYVVFGAFFSKNFVVISTLCHLIVWHNMEMYPFFISHGKIEHFSDEVEVCKTYLKDLYLFLWKGEAHKTEYFESTGIQIPPEEYTRLLSITSHPGLQPLLAQIRASVQADPNKEFSEESLIRIYKKYAGGIYSLKVAYEGGERPVASSSGE